MSVTIKEILDTDPMSDGPIDINANFATVKQHIEDLETLLNPSSTTIKLTNYTTLPTGYAEIAGIVLTGASGYLIQVNPNGNASPLPFSVTYQGDVVARKITTIGTAQANRSTMAALLIGTAGDSESDSDLLRVNGQSTFDGIVNFNGANTQMVSKSTLFVVGDDNLTVDASKESMLYLDYYNGGSAFSTPVIFDITNMLDGQILKVFCYKINSSGGLLDNGTSSYEKFAVMSPTGSGWESLTYSKQPSFHATLPSWIEVQKITIGGAARLLIINSLNMSNIS